MLLPLLLLPPLLLLLPPPLNSTPTLKLDPLVQLILHFFSIKGFFFLSFIIIFCCFGFRPELLTFFWCDFHSKMFDCELC